LAQKIKAQVNNKNAESLTDDETDFWMELVSLSKDKE